MNADNVSQKEESAAHNIFLDPTRIDPWPAQFTRVFVDGNNLFYITNKLRQLTLHHKTHLTEKVLSSVAEAFAQTIPMTMEVVFDHAKRCVPTIELKNGSTFAISTARPQFNTTDDKLIHWATNNGGLTGSTVAVTSDRALSQQLNSLGMSIVKPGTWLKYVAKLLTGDSSVHYQQWLDAWTEKVLSESSNGQIPMM